MDKPEFVYVTYIVSTAEKVWNALIDPETTVKYWQKENVSDWNPGSRWEHVNPADGRPALVGRVVESIPPRRLVLTWAFPADEAHQERHTRVTFSIESLGDIVRLTVTHDRLDPGSKMLQGITDGWPRVLSSLKTMLETGSPLPARILSPSATPVTRI